MFDYVSMSVYRRGCVCVSMLAEGEILSNFNYNEIDLNFNYNEVDLKLNL